MCSCHLLSRSALLHANVVYGCQSISAIATGQDAYARCDRRRAIIFRGCTEVQTDHPSSGLPDDLNEELRIQRLQDWLGFAEINERECDIQEAHKATFRWALQPRKNPDDKTNPSLNLAEWFRDSDGLFWIQGKLGSGKSTLMKYVWQSPLLDGYLRAWASPKPLYRASFFSRKRARLNCRSRWKGCTEPFSHI
jgi:hypothetical protein